MQDYNAYTVWLIYERSIIRKCKDYVQQRPDNCKIISRRTKAWYIWQQYECIFTFIKLSRIETSCGTILIEENILTAKFSLRCNGFHSHSSFSITGSKQDEVSVDCRKPIHNSFFPFLTKKA